MTDARPPKSISGLVGWYTGLSAEVDGLGSLTSWKDISGQGNHVTSITGSPQVSTSKVQGPTPGEHIVAFHYGNFDNHYGDGNRANAALNGRIYADTMSHEVPPEFGSLVSGSTASGQTTYTWFPPSSASADVLVVAGGGGGGIGNGAEGGGGGGAGGLIYNKSSLVTSGSQTIVVGNGGAYGRKGYDSIFGTSTAEGGGRGGLNFEETSNEGGDGGSGGGARGAGVARAGGSGTTGQGNGGGIAPHRSGGSGGGGAGGVGGNSPGDVTLGQNASVQNNEGGDGGGGGNYSLFGTIYGENGTFSGGGGGGCYTQSGGIGGTGGSGGGGNGASSSQLNGEAGRSHSGGGGGGGMSQSYNTSIPASGGSGIVLTRIRVIKGRGQTQFPFLYGTTADGLRFPTGVITTNSTYTLFHVTRYYNPTGSPTRGRIFDGTSDSWLSGFYDGKAGVAHHSSWVTPTTDVHGNQWVLSTDQRNMYRSNGADRTTSGYSGGLSTGQITINYGQTTEKSHWACAEVIAYNRVLSTAEYLSVEAYLTAKYFNYDRVPTTGVLSGSLLNAIYYSGTEGVGGVAGYPISIGRLGQRNGNTYQTVLNISDFRLTLSSGLIRRTYSHSATAHPETETALTNLFNGATRTAGPTVVGNINTRAAAAADYYGMIWIGYIYIATTGTYTFGTNSDDASDIHINYTRVTHAYNGHGVEADGVPYGAEQYTAYLEQGYYRFSYRFEEMGGGDGYQALWKTPGSTSWAVIPSSVFFHDSRDQITSSEPTDPTVPFP